MRPTFTDLWRAIAIAITGIAFFVLAIGSFVLYEYAVGTPIPPSKSQLWTQSLSNGPAPVPALCYHYLRGTAGPLRVLKVLGYVVLSLPTLNDSEIWTHNVGAFAKQMKYMHDNGYNTITLDQFCEWQEGRGELPAKPVLLTFDDGDRSVYEYAFPILKKYDFTATLFVITDKVGQEWEKIDGVTWNELREMSDSGVFTIESHTHDMHYKVRDGDQDVPVFIAASRGDYRIREHSWRDAIYNDLVLSRDEIFVNIGRRSRYLAWPYGQGSAAVDSLAMAAGFTRVLSMQHGTNFSFDSAISRSLPEWERRQIDRYVVSARTSMGDFQRLLQNQLRPQSADTDVSSTK